MTRPVIGVPWPKPDYLDAVRAAGGEPRVLTPEADPVPDVLDGCDGLLLTGGVDVDPRHYGAEVQHETVQTDPDRDAYELALARAAIARDLPVFAICRGVQLLNVAAGGTLVQDIPTEIGTPVPHREPERTTDMVHDVTVTPGTRLAAALGPAASVPLGVNSRHHQAVKDVAPGFVAAAHAPDGLVEAIERPGARFCLGVQWHPENFWRTGEYRELFDALVRAAAAARTDNSQLRTQN